MSRLKNIIILSCKSSGSSALQNILTKLPGIHHVRKTRHFEYETLYWTKAASILGLPQKQMVDSEVPIPSTQAKQDMIDLLRANVDSFNATDNHSELIFGGYYSLCKQYAPVFLEKSPHHLYQWAALELMEQCVERFPKIDFLFIGLVRNPMDTVYSTFRRWKSRPEDVEQEWFESYSNLLRFKERLGDRVIIYRYEDVVDDPDLLKPVLEFADVDADQLDRNYFHKRSLSRWKHDNLFGFVLSEEVASLAQQYGYSRQDLSNGGRLIWPFYRETSRAYHNLSFPIKRRISNLIR